MIWAHTKTHIIPHIIPLHAISSLISSLSSHIIPHIIPLQPYHPPYHPSQLISSLHLIFTSLIPLALNVKEWYYCGSSFVILSHITLILGANTQYRAGAESEKWYYSL